MAPYKLKKMTIKELRKAFLAMMTPLWDIALVGQPKSEVTKAAKALLALQRTRLRLGNKDLKEIRDSLIKNEVDLKKSKQELEDALDNLENVQSVLKAIDGFLQVVSGIVDFAS